MTRQRVVRPSYEDWEAYNILYVSMHDTQAITFSYTACRVIRCNHTMPRHAVSDKGGRCGVQMVQPHPHAHSSHHATHVASLHHASNERQQHPPPVSQKGAFVLRRRSGLCSTLVHSQPSSIRAASIIACDDMSSHVIACNDTARTDLIPAWGCAGCLDDAAGLEGADRLVCLVGTGLAGRQVSLVDRSVCLSE